MKELRRFAIAGIMLASGFAAYAQVAHPTLQEQLDAGYQLSKMDHANACALTVTGTTLRTQKPGIFAVPASSSIVCSAKYEDGKLSGPNALCRISVKQIASTLRNDHRVHVVKIEAKKNSILFGIVSCSNEGGSWKAEVLFQFAPGYLEKASLLEVEDKISEVLAFDNSDSEQQQAGASSGDQVPDRPPATDQGSPSQPTIRLGQTQQEVESALGQPDAKVDLGPKQIYVYKGLSLKVTFQNGKISQIE